MIKDYYRRFVEFFISTALSSLARLPAAVGTLYTKLGFKTNI